MSPLADGRIVLWEGGSLWVMQVPALPQSKSRTDFHAHHALQITLALDGEFKLHLPDRAIDATGIIVAADASHALQPRGLIALLFVDPENPEGRFLSSKRLDQELVTLLSEREVEQLRQPILELHRRSSSTDEEWRKLGQALLRSLVGMAVAPSPDRRVQRSIAWALAHLDRRISVADLAEEVGLSTDRMSHLFVEQTGLPFRTYLLWLRMCRALDAYSHGAPLTDAAHDAGFADSAHFSRTFRRMFGVAATELRVA